jgi:hypothetical protein
MAYDEGPAERLRASLQSLPGIAEKKMFGRWISPENRR